MSEEAVKRGPGRPRKTLEEKQAERLGKIEARHVPAAKPEVSAEPAAKPKYKMKAKPNWEDIDPSHDSTQGVFHIDKSEWPEGMDLLWARYEIYGKEDMQNMRDKSKSGWTPVHQSDFDGRWDGRWGQKGADYNIVHGGMALMARPEELSQKARAREARAAREQIEIKERAMLGGDMPRVTLDAQHKSALQTNKIGRSYEQIKVPED